MKDMTICPHCGNTQYDEPCCYVNRLEAQVESLSTERSGSLYLLFDGSSPDGRGQGEFKRRTFDCAEALKHFRKIKKDPYSTGSVRISTETSYEIASSESDFVSGSPEPNEQRTQKKVLQWAVESFGPIAKNRDERAARLAEEAIEVAQAEGVPEEIVAKILARVYERPVGELSREIGGVGITLEALAENAGHDLEADTEKEWRRVLSKTKDWWTKKHGEKVAAGTADLSTVDGRES